MIFGKRCKDVGWEEADIKNSIITGVAFRNFLLKGGDRMRQADSTIKGYLYQFNKSILTILEAEKDASIVLEGVIEDIDIHSPLSTTTIQCKYHEDKKYQISSVATPILEMLCHYCESAYLGKEVSYILYAYYAENVESVDMDAFVTFLGLTKDKDILCKYFHRIYIVSDSDILAIANKSQKSKDEKDQLINYYKANRATLTLRVDISEFWKVFSYVKAEQFDILKDKVIQKLEEITDYNTAISMYYPNAFSMVASLSAKSTEKERTLTKDQLVMFLTQQKSVLLNKWTLEVLDKEQIIKTKKAYLMSAFSSNPDIRAFVFSDDFLNNVDESVIRFIQEYLNKYFKKPKLQKPPIFIFGNNHSGLMQKTLLELYKYQKSVNTGLIGNTFVTDSFVNNKNCPADFVCKMALLQDISVNVLEQCQVNQLYIVGTICKSLDSANYFVEKLDVSNINIIRYLVGLSKTLEV